MRALATAVAPLGIPVARHLLYGAGHDVIPVYIAALAFAVGEVVYQRPSVLAGIVVRRIEVVAFATVLAMVASGSTVWLHRDADWSVNGLEAAGSGQV